MALIRAFIAVELPEELKKELTELKIQLKKNSPPVVKWVDPNSIHITLKFLGEISEASIDELMLAMEESAQEISPFKLAVCQLGAFPEPSTAHRLSGSGKGDIEKTGPTQKNIEAYTEQLGFKRESRAFSPHLTLGRVRDETRPNESLRIGQLLKDTAFVALHNIDVNAINLMKSQLTTTGAIHTCIGTVNLK